MEKGQSRLLKDHEFISANTLTPGYLKHREEYLSAVKRVMDSGWYILGKEVESFENEFAAWLGAKYCIGLNSGLDSLILAFRILGIGKGDEVIVPANTYIASILGVTENNAIPVLVEPDEFHNIDPGRIENAITPKTKAILVVHLYGQPCQMDKIQDIAVKYHLPIVEDCAQSHNATFEGKMTGTFGIVSCFSFYPTKNMGAFGDAGAIVTNDKDLADNARIYRNYGSEKKYHNKVQGMNSRMDEIQAALLRIKLSHIEEITREHEDIALTYIRHIHNPKIRLPLVQSKARHVWHQFVIMTREREELREYLSLNGIGTQIHYPIPPHLSEAYACLGYKRGDFPKTEAESDSVLSLPIYCGLTSDDIQYVVNKLNMF